jgi:hypothetical protein
MLSTFLAAGRTAVRQPDWDIVRALPLYRNKSEENFNELTAAGRIVLCDAADLFNESRMHESRLWM